MPFGGRSPLQALALPGVILAYKYSQFKQRRREAANRRITERELSALHNKIDKLLTKLEESEPELPTSQEDECVICINARATMQTSPCGHRVVCRRCFVKTIQSAVAQRLLPLRCVICRARVNRLITSTGTWRIQESASSYSMGNKTWSGVSGSPSSYSVDGCVAASASLYSMSSGSSYGSGVSSNTSNSTNNSSDDNSHISSSSSSSTTSSSIHRHHETCGNGCRGAIPRTYNNNNNNLQYINNDNNNNQNLHHHHHRRGDIHHRYAKGRVSELHHLPPIIEYKSPTKSCLSLQQSISIPVPVVAATKPTAPSTTVSASPSMNSINPGKIRFASYTQKTIIPNGNKETKSTAPSSSAIDNKSINTSTIRKPSIITAKSRLNNSKISPINGKSPINTTSLISSPSSLKITHPPITTTTAIKSTISPSSSSTINRKYDNKNAFTLQRNQLINNKIRNKNIINNNNNVNSNNSDSETDSSSGHCNNKYSKSTIGGGKQITCTATIHAQPKSPRMMMMTTPMADLLEKSDNKRNECILENKKKEEKLKIKADKEAKKEEKRLAKEEERLAKILAKEGKKKLKNKDDKELLLLTNNKN